VNDEPVDVPPRVRAAQAHATQTGFAMSCTNRTGALLRTLAATKPGGRLLEIGTGVGVGAAWLLAGASPTAHLVTIEIDPATADVARTVLHGDPRTTVITADAAVWLAGHTGPPFDLVFVDWRVGKFEHRGLLLAHLNPGGVYVGDDLLPQPTWPHDHQARVDKFLTDIVGEHDLTVTLLDWASGLVVAARRSPA